MREATLESLLACWEKPRSCLTTSKSLSAWQPHNNLIDAMLAAELVLA